MLRPATPTHGRRFEGDRRKARDPALATVEQVNHRLVAVRPSAPSDAATEAAQLGSIARFATRSTVFSAVSRRNAKWSAPTDTQRNPPDATRPTRAERRSPIGSARASERPRSQVQQEAPAEVNAALQAFIDLLD